jgi:hypothetical protein
MSNSAIHPLALELLKFTDSHKRHYEALMRATGEHFNLFQVLNIGHYEVRTHSPILAELLNPKGRHGQGAVFLSLFLNQCGIGENDFHAESSKVAVEYHIGNKTEDTGGRIDIVIEDGKRRRILIENKIYAGDQENQMTRYGNFDDGARLFYLTLFGDKPSGLKQEEEMATRCECISYKDHIRDWLMDCRKEAACLPNVREMLSQYISLIEELTHQSTNKLMNDELINRILDTPESLSAFHTLRDAESAVRKKLISQLDVTLEEIAKELKLSKEGDLQRLDSKNGYFSLSTPSLTRNNTSIYFEFGMKNYCGLYFGFRKQKYELPCPIGTELQIQFAEKFEALPLTPWWPARANYETPYQHWGHGAFEAIRSGKMAEDIKKKIEVMAEIAKKACGEAEALQTTPVSHDL